jgi:hypothetical protein
MTDLYDLIIWHTRRAALAGRMETIEWYAASAQRAGGAGTGLRLVPAAS